MNASKVVLIGAGPGDPELLTLKAVRYLQLADVVLIDRLVSEAILYQWVNPKAQIIFVGKEGRNAASFKQKSINDLLIEHAVNGQLVVRLKGGDVAFFSNVLDEIQTLSDYDIPFEIVPGITAASGASASAMIPLTARGYATGVRFMTQYKMGNLSTRYWKSLTDSQDTLVFYMSGSNLSKIAHELKLSGMNEDHKIAVIEQATTPNQRVFVYSLDDAINGQIQDEFLSPSLIIIGKVVQLHQLYHREQNDSSGNQKKYFRTLGHTFQTIAE